MKDVVNTNYPHVSFKAAPLDSDYLHYLEAVAKSQMTCDFLNKTLQPRFRADVVGYTGFVSIADVTRLHQFDSACREKLYYISQAEDHIFLDFMSKFDYDKGLNEEQVEFLKSNDVEIEIIKTMLELTASVEDLESLADKITLLADFLKDFE